MAKNARAFFTKQQKDEIVGAVKEAELNTSGEIRVHIENFCNSFVMDRAAFIFDKLEMQKTQLRNGVLFYLAVKSKKFAIIGDAGINKVVNADFWDNIKEEMVIDFANGDFTKGLAKGIRITGEKLKDNFPYQDDDVNELPDEISFGE